MNTITNILNAVIEMFYTNLSSYIYAVLTTVIGGIFSYIFSYIKSLKTEYNWLGIYQTVYDGGGCLLFLITIIPFFFFLLLSIVVCAYIQVIFQIPYQQKTFMTAVVVASLAATGAMAEVAARKIGKLRVQFLGNKIRKLFLYFPLVYLGLPFLCQTWFQKISPVANAGIILLFFVELLGVQCTQTEYIYYKYKKVVFYLEDGEQINCNDITKLRKRKNIVRVEQGDKIVCFKYSDIKRTEYSGEDVVRLIHIPIGKKSRHKT